jgi:tetratricopeptide (TPR) repeat protein
MGGGLFVGRREELARLEGAIAVARSGRAQMVLLAGEAGVGKTTVATEIMRRAAEAGARTATGRAWEGAGAPAFWLWRECLRELGEEIALPRAIVAGEDRFAALESIAACVRALSRDTLLVMLLDDVQWADVPSLLALKLLMRSARSDRLCIVATVRAPDEAAPEVSSVIADIRREAVVLTMHGLPRDDLAELARTCGIRDDQAIDVIAQATSGNALFAVELLGDHDARRALEDGRPLPAPRGVRDVLVRHLARLSDGDQDVVAWAAVCGEPIDVAAIASASAFSSAQLASAVDVACREGVLSSGDGTLRFAHALFRSAAYDSVVQERRARMHEALARVLRERDPNGAASIRHLLAADPSSSNADVARAALHAARAAIVRMSYEEAADLARKAAGIFERSGRRADLAMALASVAEARVLGGNAEGSIADAERALLVARDSGDAVALAHAVLALGQRRTLGTASRPLAAMLDEALARLEAENNEDRGLLCAVEARLASALQPNIDPPRAVETGRRAIARAREMGNSEILARTMNAARPAFRMLEPHDERASMDLETLALSERLGDEPLAAHAMARVFWDALEAGDATLADSTLIAFEKLALKIRLPHHELVARAARCVRELMQGHFEAAEQHLAHIDATRDRWRPAVAAALPMDPAMILRMSLAAARREAFDYTALGTPGEVPPESFAVFRAFFDARAGRLEQASAALRVIIQRIGTAEWSYMMRILLGDACARTHATEYADHLYELCLPFEGRHIVMTPFPAYDGAMDRLLGALAHVRGDRNASLRHYEAAIAMEEKLGAAAFVARSRDERDALFGPASARASVPASTPSAARPTFVQQGDVWLVTFCDESTHVKDADGLRYLAYLVARPDVGVAVVELFGERAGVRGETATPSGDAGEVLDREAIAAYRERARDLRESLEDAEARNDMGAAERAKTELSFLEQELSRAVGLGGRSRRAASDHERIRVNVTTRIRKIIDKLGEQAPLLARHLKASIRTGSTCSYQPP